MGYIIRFVLERVENIVGKKLLLIVATLCQYAFKSFFP